MRRVAEAPDAVDIHDLEEVLVDRQHAPLFVVREEADKLVVHQLALIVVVAHLQRIVEVLALDDVEGLAVAVEGDTTRLPRGAAQVDGLVDGEDIIVSLVIGLDVVARGVHTPEAQDDEGACPLFVSLDHILDRGLHGLDLARGEEESEDAQKEGEHRGETLTA